MSPRGLVSQSSCSRLPPPQPLLLARGPHGHSSHREGARATDASWAGTEAPVCPGAGPYGAGVALSEHREAQGWSDGPTPRGQGGCWLNKGGRACGCHGRRYPRQGLAAVQGGRGVCATWVMSGTDIPAAALAAWPLPQGHGSRWQTSPLRGSGTGQAGAVWTGPVPSSAPTSPEGARSSVSSAGLRAANGSFSPCGDSTAAPPGTRPVQRLQIHAPPDTARPGREMGSNPGPAAASPCHERPQDFPPRTP